MKTGIIVLLLGLMGLEAEAQKPQWKSKPEAQVEKITIEYQGKKVNARRLTVSSVLPLSAEEVWKKVQTPALLEFVAKGKARFKPVDGQFPDLWQEGDTVASRTRLYGFIPFGGVRYLFFEKIDHERKFIQTREWDPAAKLWDHAIWVEAIDGQRARYTDQIIIYGGGKTGLITWWAKSFYKHRQKRWQLVSEK